MNLEPPPQVNVFNWIWQKWLNNLYAFVQPLVDVVVVWLTIPDNTHKATVVRGLGKRDSTQYPEKYYPIAAWFELLRLSPNVTAFDTNPGGLSNYMTEAYLRETIQEANDAGINTIIVPYVEFLGFWFYTPSFSYPTDHDTTQTGDYWHDQLLGVYPKVDNFNPVHVILQECEVLKIKVFLGLGRNGDTLLFSDLSLYYDNPTGNPAGGADPVRYSLSLTTRLSNAQDRTRQVAADLVNQFDSFPSFHGFYISHEPDEFEFSNQYTANVTLVAGTDPTLRSYGKAILIGPPSPSDLAASAAFAARLVASGCDIFAAQDSAGPGHDYDNARDTFIPTVTTALLDGHYDLWRQAMDIANSIASISTRRLTLWSNTEVWKMGDVIAQTLTLSAAGGAAITATAGAASFVAGDVGKFITEDGAGRGEITGFTSTTIVTVDTTYTGEPLIADGATFSSTSISASAWAVSDGYQNDHPTTWAQLQGQMQKEQPHVEGMALYAWFGFMDSGNNTLVPKETNSSRTDFATAAALLYSNYITWQAGQRLRYQDHPPETLLQHRIFNTGSAGANTTITNDFATFYPKHPGSKIVYKFYIRGSSAAGTTSITFNARVNSAVIDSVIEHAAGDRVESPPTLFYQERPEGLDRLIGFSFTTTGGINYTLDSVDIEVMEIV